ncbi:GEL complex subunit OPTI-like isoform X2 [Corticium candelabrum]|uniref:GEL complex subunit OPTI-like isoform X2 n=1 Tax=Corticium candelabrum TaxID=121492 RepID=UPI002E26B4BA|nr:GEL complex subunit OPTI-like isoform X2 [Corticium candelabrum]
MKKPNLGKAWALWRRAVAPKSVWKAEDDKDDFLDVIYWLRQFLSVIVGFIWGLVALKGIVGLALFFAVNAGTVYLFCTVYQSIDEEEFGGLWELLKEGFFTSFALFLVVWIIVYSSLHFD